MSGDTWSFDDIVLAAVLGSWLGAQADIWTHPLRGAGLTATAVLLVYCAHAMVLGDRRTRWVFALPTVLVGCLVWLETLGPVAGAHAGWQMIAILAVWLCSVGLRALGSTLRRLK